MKELDVLFQGYLDSYYPTASEAERSAFSSLLDQQDPVLLAYVTGREQPTDEHQRRVIDTLRRTA